MSCRKLFSTLSLLIAFIFFPLISGAQTFLTYEQFQILPISHKIEYIGDLQRLVASVGSHPELASATRATSLLENLIFNLLPQAEADIVQQRNWNCRVPSASHLSNTELLSKIDNTGNCTEISVNGSPQYFLPSVAERLKNLSSELAKRIANGKIKYNDRAIAAIGTLEWKINKFNQVGTRDGQNYQADIRSAAQSLAGIGRAKTKAKKKAKTNANTDTNTDTRISRVMPATSKAAPVVFPQTTKTALQTQSFVIKNKASEKPSESHHSETETPKKSPQTTAATTQTDAVTSVKPERLSDFPLLCLYAGFVIAKNTQNSCQPFKKLPTSFVGDFFDENQFVCASAKEILCNPLIFGYEPNCGSDADTSCKAKKPLCTLRSQQATKNCFDLSQQKQTRPQVLKIWESPYGKKAYETFIQSLQQLCDPQNLKSRNLRPAAHLDISTTCTSAIQTMNQNMEDKFLPTLKTFEKIQKEIHPEGTD